MAGRPKGGPLVDQTTGTRGGFVNSYGYNANGDQTTRTLAGTSSTLTYDFDDQLLSTGGAAFAYDAAGRRVSRTAGGVTTSFLFDGGGVLLEKQGGTTTATYTYGNSLIRKDGETPLFDGLGSERTVTNSGQAVTASLTLSAFGQTVASSGSSSSAYQFGATSGYRSEGDAGLTLVGCRFYDAQVGRFITRDTYLDQAPYTYCNGDPVNCVDPTGHDPKSKPKEKGWFDKAKDIFEKIFHEKPGGSVHGGINGGTDKNGKSTYHWSFRFQIHW